MALSHPSFPRWLDTSLSFNILSILWLADHVLLAFSESFCWSSTPSKYFCYFSSHIVSTWPSGSVDKRHIWGIFWSPTSDFDKPVHYLDTFPSMPRHLPPQWSSMVFAMVFCHPPSFFLSWYILSRIQHWTEILKWHERAWLNLQKESVPNRAVKTGNFLPEYVVNAPSIDSFKNRIDTQGTEEMLYDLLTKQPHQQDAKSLYRLAHKIWS